MITSVSVPLHEFMNNIIWLAGGFPKYDPRLWGFGSNTLDSFLGGIRVTSNVATKMKVMEGLA